MEHYKCDCYITSECWGTWHLTPQPWTQAPHRCSALFTQDWAPVHPSFSTMVKFADDTTVVDLTAGNSETWYRTEVQHLVERCTDHQTQGGHHRGPGEPPRPPLYIREGGLGIHLTKELTWPVKTTKLVTKAQQRWFFLRKQAGLAPELLKGARAGTVEDRKHLSHLVKAAQRIVGAELLDLDYVCAERLKRRARPISNGQEPPRTLAFWGIASSA